jgi:hypothetical protein
LDTTHLLQKIRIQYSHHKKRSWSFTFDISFQPSLHRTPDFDPKPRQAQSDCQDTRGCSGVCFLSGIATSVSGRAALYQRDSHCGWDQTCQGICDYRYCSCFIVAFCFDRDHRSGRGNKSPITLRLKICWTGTNRDCRHICRGG